MLNFGGVSARLSLSHTSSHPCATSMLGDSRKENFVRMQFRFLPLVVLLSISMTVEPAEAFPGPTSAPDQPMAEPTSPSLPNATSEGTSKKSTDVPSALPSFEGSKSAIRNWLRALISKKAASVAALSGFPFTHDGSMTGVVVKTNCKKKLGAADVAAFDAIFVCLADDAFLDDLKHIEPDMWDWVWVAPANLKKPEVPASMRKLATDHSIVLLTLTGNGIGYHLAFAVRNQDGRAVVSATYVEGYVFE